MIGSVHGCMSCPVVVKPWEPESLSHHQHHPQAHIPDSSITYPPPHYYPTPQRSASVHPWHDSISATDDILRGSKILSPRRLANWSRRCSRHQSAHADEKENLPKIITASPGRKGSASHSSKKKRSLSSSPEKLRSVFRLQQEFAEGYENLLKLTDPEISDFVLPATSFHLPTVSEDLRGVYCIESKDKAEPSVPMLLPVKMLETTKLKENISLMTDKNREYKPSEKETMKSSTMKGGENTPGTVSLEVDTKGLHMYNYGMALVPSPLPSLPNKSKRVKKKYSHVLPSTVPPLKPLRQSKGLFPLAIPNLQAVGICMVPPVPSLNHQRGKKHSFDRSKPSSEGFLLSKDDRNSNAKVKYYSRKVTPQAMTPKSSLEHETDVATVTDFKPITVESFAKNESSARLQQQQQNAQSASCQPLGSSHPSFSSQMVGNKVNSSQNYSVVGEKINTTKTSPKQQAVVLSLKHDLQDAPTPHSLDSESCSLLGAAATPEVDALTTAAAAGDLAKVKALLDGGVEVNAVNTFGRTAVQVMALDNVELAELLLSRGADPNIQDKGRRAATSTLRTIAHDAAASGYMDMLRCLLRHGADVNLMDRWGNTPLHLAAKGGHLEAVRLLRRGTSINQSNHLGKTPIMLLEDTGSSAAKQWVEIKKATISRLQTLCILAMRQHLGTAGLQRWKLLTSEQMNDVVLRQVLLQSKGCWKLPQGSLPASHQSSHHSLGSTSLVRGKGGNSNGGGHPLLPGMTYSKQMNDFLTLRDLVPRRLSTGENTSLEVHNSSSGQSTEDTCPKGIPACSSLASETGSLFETNLSSIEASQHSTDDLSIPSFDQSL